MKAGDIMTARVITISPDATVLAAIDLMTKNHISGLPVIDSSGALVGMVTEGDFLRRAETGTARKRPRWLEFLVGPGRLAEEYVETHARKVGEVMTRDLVTIAEDTPLAEVVHQMEHRRVKRLPVMRGTQLVGIVSRANLMRALAAVGREVPAPAQTDAAIRKQLLAEFEKQTWVPVGADRRHRQGRRRRIVGHHPGRLPGRGDPGLRRERARREEGGQPPHLGRADVRHGDQRRRYRPAAARCGAASKGISRL